MARGRSLQFAGIMEFFPNPGCRRLPLFLLLLAAAPLRAEPPAPAAPPQGKPEIRSFDKNGDGKPDKWAVFIDGKVVEIGYDRNHDGKRDFWEFLNPNGRMARTESDRNHDGRPDLVVYYENGHLAFKMVDDDYDGVPERIAYFDGDERVGLTSQDFEQIRSEPSRAMAADSRPGAAKPAASPVPATVAAARPVSGRKRPAEIRPAGPPAPPDLLPAPGTAPPEPEPDGLAYFPLGSGFPVRIPVPGGAAALEENRVWTVERDQKLFRWPDAGASFEIQNTPTQGAIRVRYESRDDEGDRAARGEFARRAGSFARRAFGRLIYVNEGRREIESSLGPGHLETFTVKAGRQTYRVTLCTVLSRDYWVYFMAASSRETHEALESALVEMLRGAQTG